MEKNNIPTAKSNTYMFYVVQKYRSGELRIQVIYKRTIFAVNISKTIPDKEQSVRSNIHEEYLVCCEAGV